MKRAARLVVPLAVSVGIVFVVVGSHLSPGTTPVDLATPIDMGLGVAHASAVVHVGSVRVEALSPIMFRLEYPPAQHFVDSPP